MSLNQRKQIFQINSLDLYNSVTLPPNSRSYRLNKRKAFGRENYYFEHIPPQHVTGWSVRCIRESPWLGSRGTHFLSSHWHQTERQTHGREQLVPWVSKHVLRNHLASLGRSL